MNAPAPTWVEVSRSRDRRRVRHHTLVLQSIGMPHGVLDNQGESVLIVRSEHVARALDELQRYERENVGFGAREVPPKPVSSGVYAAILYAGVVTLFFLMQAQQRFGIDWTRVGRLEADRVRDGELWRAFTALCLHADLSHLAGNLVFGAAFGVVLAQSVGVALAWWGFVLAGGLGNILNAWVQDASHRSIGASTAVFGALGLQVAYEWMRRRDLAYRGWRRWSPVVMGLGLLAWLGAGGATPDDPRSANAALERVDIGAHVFGFLAGAGLGLLLGLRKTQWRWSPRTQLWVTLLVPVFVAWMWFFALRK